MNSKKKAGFEELYFSDEKFVTLVVDGEKRKESLLECKKARKKWAFIFKIFLVAYILVSFVHHQALLKWVRLKEFWKYLDDPLTMQCLELISSYLLCAVILFALALVVLNAWIKFLKLAEAAGWKRLSDKE